MRMFDKSFVSVSLPQMFICSMLCRFFVFVLLHQQRPRKYVCVHLLACTYADNGTLPAIAGRTPRQTIDISYSPGPQQQTRRSLVGEWDRQTDGRKPYSFIERAVHGVRIMNASRLCVVRGSENGVYSDQRPYGARSAAFNNIVRSANVTSL